MHLPLLRAVACMKQPPHMVPFLVNEQQTLSPSCRRISQVRGGFAHTPAVRPDHTDTVGGYLKHFWKRKRLLG